MGSQTPNKWCGQQGRRERLDGLTNGDIHESWEDDKNRPVLLYVHPPAADCAREHPRGGEWGYPPAVEV